MTTETTTQTPWQHGYEDGAQMTFESMDLAHLEVEERGYYRLDTRAWDGLLINAMGRAFVCELFGEDTEANEGEWTEAMERKLREYNDGAVAGARATLIENGIAEDVIRDGD